MTKARTSASRFARTKDAAYAARAGAPGAAKVDASVIDSIVKALGDVK